MPKETYKNKAFNCVLAYAFRGLAGDRHGKEHGGKEVGLVLAQ